MTEAEARQKLRAGGYDNIYTWFDSPETEYEEHTHPNERHYIILEGMMNVTMDEDARDYNAGDEFNVPAEQSHVVVVGEHGCNYAVGEHPV